MDLIQIKDLSFSYPAKKDTLKHVNLKVKKVLVLFLQNLKLQLKQ